MADNIIELKPIGDLLGLKFFIPSYQRGYRWTEQQVNDLLNDINEFTHKLNPNKKDNPDVIDDFYCLQPLVVKECIENKEDFLNELPTIDEIDNDVLSMTRKVIADNTKWEVIDGQQRLTTIYILFYFLEDNHKGLYSIDYQTREGFKNYLDRIVESVKFKILNFDETRTKKAFVDEIFNTLTKECSEWNNIDYYHILQTFVTIKYWFEVEVADLSKEIFKEMLLNRVKFIWYESVDENPIKVFTRLNIGKIKLTNAELIKALFLNRSHFKIETNEHVKLRQQEIASEWDVIEYTLQNDEFWLFIHQENYDKPTRIDFIFDLICKRQSLGAFDSIGKDDYKTFRYFYEYFKSKNHDIKTCWNDIKEYFNVFKEWFNDLELYHYVGYLITITEGNDINDLYSDLYSLWVASATKASFIVFLKEKIKEILRKKGCCDLNKQYEIEGGPAKTDCKPLLLLHNIQTVINQNQAYSSKEEYKLPVFYKFPFHLYKSEKWDVEHIDSNTTNALDNEKDQKEWLKYALLDKNLSEGLVNSIKSFLNNEPDKKSFDELSKNVEIQTSHDAYWDDAEKDKNKIWNFVLLDQRTNRGYGNAIFPAKRRCIIGKDQGKTITIDDNLEEQVNPGAIAFVPPVTKNVFLKYYNTIEANFRSWSKTDADAYKANILETLNDFDVIDSSNSKNEK